MSLLRAFTLGVFGFVVVAAVAWREPEVFPYAWLAALVTWIAWPLGSIGLLLIHSLTGGRWGFAIRPQLVVGIRTLPMLAPFLAPLLVAAKQLYPWLMSQSAAPMNGFYLNAPAASARIVVYLVVWFALALAILRAIRKAPPDPALERIAPAGLILLALSVTFASIDAILSLDPHFASSIFGMITIGEMGLTALSIAVLVSAMTSPLDHVTLGQLGRLLIALTILWAYLDFMQLLIVWQSDLPNEASWYSIRWRGFWGDLALTISCVHFALPFIILLSARMRHSRVAMILLSGLLLAGAILRSLWLVAPPFSASLVWAEAWVMAGVTAMVSAAAIYLKSITGAAKNHVQTRS